MSFVLLFNLVLLWYVKGSTQNDDSDGFCESPDGCAMENDIYNEGNILSSLNYLINN